MEHQKVQQQQETQAGIVIQLEQEQVTTKIVIGQMLRTQMEVISYGYQDLHTE